MTAINDWWQFPYVTLHVRYNSELQCTVYLQFKLYATAILCTSTTQGAILSNTATTQHTAATTQVSPPLPHSKHETRGICYLIFQSPTPPSFETRDRETQPTAATTRLIMATIQPMQKNTSPPPSHEMRDRGIFNLIFLEPVHPLRRSKHETEAFTLFPTSPLSPPSLERRDRGSIFYVICPHPLHRSKREAEGGIFDLIYLQPVPHPLPHSRNARGRGFSQHILF
jgi:hypothetical protein